MQGQLFQLLDVDGENVGLIWTDLEGERDFQNDFKEYYNNSEDPNADDFCVLMNQKGVGYFERVFVNELNA